MSTGTTTTSTGVMEQARYWMWMKRRIMMSEKPATYVHDHYNYSTTTTTTNSTFKQDDVESSNWEEQAFVEDSTGPLGGFIWPPRSYSCSFCGREFRSAQALGGHMNVHRRDRARLKGSPSPTSSTTTSPPKYENKSLQHHDHHHKRPYSSFNDDQVCKVVYNNSNPSFVSSLPLSTPKIICEDTSTTLGSSRSCSSTSYVHHDDQEKQKGSLLSLDLHHPCGPCSDPVAIRVINLSSTTTVSSRSKLKNSNRAHEIAGFEAKYEDNYINVKPAADSAVMNCLFANRPTGLDSNEDGNKKRRQDYASSLLPFSLKTGSVVDQCRHFHNKVPGLIPSSMEELDLELRLGDRPKR